MEQMETKQKKPYVPPTVLDISPVTVNVAVGENSDGNWGDDGADDD